MRLNLIFVMIVLGLFYLLAPLLVMFFVKDDKKYKVFKIVLLSSFFVLLLVGVLFNIDISKNTIYVGFDFSKNWFNKSIIWKFPNFKIDLFINSVMLMPVGSWVFIEHNRKKKKMGLLYAIFAGFLLGFVVEVFQFVLPVNRSVQLSDMILNTLSSLIGYLYVAIFYWGYKLIKKFVCNEKK